MPRTAPPVDHDALDRKLTEAEAAAQRVGEHVDRMLGDRMQAHRLISNVLADDSSALSRRSMHYLTECLRLTEVNR